MRICFLNRSYYPDLGAVGQLLTELTEDLVHDYGCSVSVVAGRPLLQTTEPQVRTGRWRPVSRELHNGVEVFRAAGTTFVPRRFVGRATNYLTYFLSALLAGLQVPRPDVVVSLTDPPIIGLAGLLVARRSGASFVFLCQDIFPEVARLLEDFRSETVNWLLDRISRFLIRKADRVVALSEIMGERLIAGKGADPRKVRVIYNWADCSKIVPGQKKNSFSLAHGLAEKFVVMHSGNIGLSQGLETVVEATTYIKDFPHIQMVFIGDGVKRVALERQVQSLGLGNVRFLPYQPKERLADSFATADVFIVSLKHGLAGYIAPSKLYGILASGRPYVAAVEEESEVAEITKKFDCGLLAKPGDPEDLAKKILALYHDRSLAQRLGGNGREAALLFDRASQVKAYYGLFDELVGSVPIHESFLKRLFDFGLAAFGLVLFSPVWVLISVAIYLEDGRPILFVQRRVGKCGKEFTAYKFRTIYKRFDDKVAKGIAVHSDDRMVMRVGRILRKTAMNELPQLLNILKGDMSFVGPRPEPPEFIAAYEQRIPNLGRLRYQVRPGLTGIAQVYGPHDMNPRNKLRYDLLYTRKRSFWLDLKLIARSVWNTVRGKWDA